MRLWRDRPCDTCKALEARYCVSLDKATRLDADAQSRQLRRPVASEAETARTGRQQVIHSVWISG